MQAFELHIFYLQFGKEGNTSLSPISVLSQKWSTPHEDLFEALTLPVQLLRQLSKQLVIHLPVQFLITQHTASRHTDIGTGIDMCSFFPHKTNICQWVACNCIKSYLFNTGLMLFFPIISFNFLLFLLVNLYCIILEQTMLSTIHSIYNDKSPL